MALKKLFILVLIIFNFVCLYIATDKSVYNQIVLSQDSGVLYQAPTIIMLCTFITNLIVLTLVDFRKRMF
ncbi:MAG: hypothetical protein WCY89_07775 [Flavobacteriaceae bacterium]